MAHRIAPLPTSLPLWALLVALPVACDKGSEAAGSASHAPPTADAAPLPDPSAAANTEPTANVVNRASPLAIGDQAPGFRLPDGNGDAFVLSEALASGPVVAVFYRGSW
ncbi:MAG: hypothetical protein JKY37_14145 [Nannocystaceae bacterium]|nr:hypothetical protein [Nannocystaceae bacterium]